MKPPSYHYFRIKAPDTGMRIEFESMQDFHRYLELHHQKTIFVIADARGQTTHFAVLQNGSVLQQATQGFELLEDFLAAEQNDFPDATHYYEARKEGYHRYEDYKLVKESGISDKEEFEKIKSGGYIEGYHAYMNEKEAGRKTFSFSNPNELYQYATSKGFTSWPHFNEATTKGFEDADTYKVAKEKNFDNAADYAEGMKRGCLTGDDLKLMREEKVRDREDFNRMIDLKYVKGKSELNFDECALLVILSKLPDEKKISINKLSELFEKAKEEYRYKDTAEMPEWFTANLGDRNAVISFLAKNESVKKYGHYDNDGEYFETKKLRDRNVVIDGSNVAHNSNGKANSKPEIANIIKLAEELKRKGFTGITVIVDASLRHRIADPEKIKELKEIAEYLEAPAENPADIFIIQYVKRTHCLLVSNDTFREWKAKEVWVAENIDYYRMSFMINGETVLLPDLKDK